MRKVDVIIAFLLGMIVACILLVALVETGHAQYRPSPPKTVEYTFIVLNDGKPFPINVIDMQEVNIKLPISGGYAPYSCTNVTGLPKYLYVTNDCIIKGHVDLSANTGSVSNKQEVKKK